MKILIYGINFSPELTGIGKYTGEMAEWLAQQGYDVHVITAPPYYPTWKIGDAYSSWKYTKEALKGIKVFRCPLWVPAKPKTITRLIHLLSFSCSSLVVLFKQLFFWQPDVVICLAPSFFCAPQTALLGKLAGVKSWLHFQDFEICAMFGSGMGGGWQTINKIAHKIQSVITRRFDVVSSISRTMCNSAERNHVSNKKVVLFPNWVDIDFITPAADGLYFRKKWKIPETTKVILYSGNLGKKQGLENFLDAAHSLRNNDKILFIVVGGGAHKAALTQQSQAMGLKNVQFYSLQPYQYLPKLLRMANIHLIIQKRGAADAVLPSKLTSILSVGGHAIITAEPDTELGQLVQEFPGIATLIPPEDPVALTESISKLCHSPHIGAEQINKQAREYAEQYLSKEPILKTLEQELTTLLTDKQ